MSIFQSEGNAIVFPDTVIAPHCDYWWFTFKKPKHAKRLALFSYLSPFEVSPTTRYIPKKQFLVMNRDLYNFLEEQCSEFRIECEYDRLWRPTKVKTKILFRDDSDISAVQLYFNNWKYSLSSYAEDPLIVYPIYGVW